MKIKSKILIVFGVLFALLFLFLTFQRTKKLRGIDYLLLDDDFSVSLCHYEGDRFSGSVVVNFVKQVFGDDKYIVAQAEGKYSDVYYIIE